MINCKINSKFYFENEEFQIVEINNFYVRCILLNKTPDPNLFNENNNKIIALTEPPSTIKDFSIDEINAIFKNKKLK